MSVSSEKFSFPGSRGDQLAARLDSPRGEVKAYALFAHCFTCSKDVFAAARIAAGLAERGIAVLRFDFTGLGASGGDFANTNFSSNVEDLIAAADYLRETREAPVVLIGHSLGGAAVLAAAEGVPEARAVATIGAPAEPGQVEHLLAEARPEIEAAGEAEVVLAGRSFRIRKQFLDDIAATRIEGAIGKLGKALLVCHAPGDEFVDIDNAARIFQAAKHPKSYLSLDDADHLLSRRADAAYAAAVIAAWAGRYLGAADDTGRAAPAVAPGTVLVAETGESKFTNLVSDGRHGFMADEPEAVGGLDMGPNPYELLLAALGACTSMTLRMYAERKGWPLVKVAVRLAHEKIHAEDCAECETKEGKIDHIEREIEIVGGLDDGQRQRLLEIADRCPVHRTLVSENVIATRLMAPPT